MNMSNITVFATGLMVLTEICKINFLNTFEVLLKKTKLGAFFNLYKTCRFPVTYREYYQL